MHDHFGSQCSRHEFHKENKKYSLQFLKNMKHILFQTMTMNIINNEK
jgi:hypothetical protein